MSNFWLMWSIPCTTWICSLDRHGLSRYMPVFLHSYCSFCSHISHLNICSSRIVCSLWLFSEQLYRVILVSNTISSPAVPWRWCGCEQEDWVLFEQLANEALPVWENTIIWSQIGSTKHRLWSDAMLATTGRLTPHQLNFSLIGTHSIHGYLEIPQEFYWSYLHIFNHKPSFRSMSWHGFASASNSL